MIPGFEQIRCGGCSIIYYVPDFWLADKRETSDGFSCPNGCRRHFSESEADKIRRERDRLKQRLAEKDDDIRRQREWREHAERSAAAYRGQATRLRNRAKAGVCPCCNRQFQNVRRHMANKHPDFQADAPELKVVEGGAA